jgi:hypothetical protein
MTSRTTRSHDAYPLRAATNQLSKAFSANKTFHQAANSVVAIGLEDPTWSRRMLGLNGGVWPDRARVTELLLDHAITQERLARFYLSVVEIPSVKRALAAAASQLLVAPSFQDHVKQAARSLVSDRAFRKAFVEFAAELLEGPGHGSSDDPMRMFEANVLETAVAGLLGQTLDDAALLPIGQEAMSAFATDREVLREMAKLVNDW